MPSRAESVGGRSKREEILRRSPFSPPEPHQLAKLTLLKHAPKPSSAPSFLSLPLSDPATFVRIGEALSSREQARHELAHRVEAQRKAGLMPAGGTGTHAGSERFAVEKGLHPAHKRKNRYCDIVAYDRTRILLPFVGGEDEYVNASLIWEPSIGVASLPRYPWIAAQAPVPSTLHAFLSLLLVSPTSPASTTPLPPPSLIIQLTPLVEGSRQKCHPYFPHAVGETLGVPGPRGEKGVWVRLVGKEKKDGRRTSQLLVGWDGEPLGRQVTHVEYLAWSDHGVPESPSHLLAFIRTMTALQHSLSPSPPLLHCSAGVGRTGTYLAIASLLPLLPLFRTSPPPLEKLEQHETHPLQPYPADEVVEGTRDYVGLTIDGLREQRTTMCQTLGQVRWVYEALEEAWREGE